MYETTLKTAKPPRPDVPNAPKLYTIGPPQKTKPLRSFCVLLLLSTCLVFSIRALLFGSAEPRVDQAYFAASVRQLVEADHVWPTSTGAGFRHALETDRDSMLYALGQPIYNSPQYFAFTLIPFLMTSGLVFLVGYSYTTITLLSIAASSLVLIPIAGICIYVGGGWSSGRNVSLMLAGSGCLLYAASAYPALYSAWGIHNCGALFLVSAVAVAMPFIANVHACGVMRPSVLTALVSVIAGYSHFTNVILLPVPLVFALLSAPGLSARRRVVVAVVCGALICAGFAPVAITTMLLNKTGTSLTYMNVGASLSDYAANIAAGAAAWFSAGAQLISLPGTIAGVAGLFWLAAVTPYRLPLFLTLWHFACYCLIPGFAWNGSNTWLRTYNYVIPFVTIGLAWILVKGSLLTSSWRLVPAIRIVILAGVVWHVVAQIPFKGYTQWANDHVPDFSHDYLIGQGALRAVVADLETISTGKPLTFWDYPARFVYCSLARNDSHVTTSTVTSIAKRIEQGQFHQMVLPPDALVVASEPEFNHNRVPATLHAVYGVDGTLRVEKRWRSPVPVYGAFAAYRVQAQ
jgi:hypothetical protein